MTYIRHRYYIIISEVVKNPSSLGVAVGHCFLLMANTQGCAVLLRWSLMHPQRFQEAVPVSLLDQFLWNIIVLEGIVVMVYLVRKAAWEEYTVSMCRIWRQGRIRWYRDSHTLPQPFLLPWRNTNVVKSKRKKLSWLGWRIELDL